MSDTSHKRDLEDRARNRVATGDVGTAASASVGGHAPAGNHPGAGIGAAGGAAGGAAAGMTAGLVTLGPIGAIIGAIAGAIGGGWVGIASSTDPLHHFAPEHDEEYRRHFESDAQRLADRSYEDTRLAYQLGHLAAANPDYAGRDFHEVEHELRRGWTPDVQEQHGSWEVASRYARAAYERRRGQTIGRGFIETEMAGTESHRRAAFSDPIPLDDPDNVAGEARLIPGREE